MSRYCAKPTCSDSAASWFEVVREIQKVTRASTETPHAIALCDVHAARFRVPEGWTFETHSVLERPPEGVDGSVLERPPEGAVAPVASAEQASSIIEKARSGEPNREHGRDNPWFVPSTIDERADAESRSDLNNAAKGSLLDRAFNGPGVKDESGRSVAPADELSSRRRARSSADEPEEDAPGLYQTCELPFPPHSSAAIAL